MSKKILITGAAGFIGSHLVEKLYKDGYDLKILVPYNTDNSWGWIDSLDEETKNNIEIISGDVCDQDLVRKKTKNERTLRTHEHCELTKIGRALRTDGN